MIIHIKYQGSLHVVVQINTNVKIVGCVLFGHRAIISKKLGRGPLADAIYQISKL